jgi:AcrR family transcriptional regulator
MPVFDQPTDHRVDSPTTEEAERVALSRRRILDAALTYFRNKDELLDRLLDRVAGDVILPDPNAKDWKRELVALARQLRQTLLAHPGLVTVIATHEPFRSQNVLRIIEGVLALLRKAGFDDETAATAFYPVFVYTNGFVSQKVASAGGAELTQSDQAEMERRLRLQFESLPADRFPNVIELAPHLARCADDEFFEFGLRCLMLGIEAQISGGPAFVTPS